MVDPLADVVSRLKPRARFTKLVVASAPWAVRRTEMGQPFFLAVLEGGCRLKIDAASGVHAFTLAPGDFVLIPAARSFSTSSLDREPPAAGERVNTPIAAMPGGARVGDPSGRVDARLLVGHCLFASPDAALLVSLLPEWLRVRGDARLATLVQLVGDESRQARPAREIVMALLLEVLLIEALRAGSSTTDVPGLVRGLQDPRIAAALRRMHERPNDPFSMARLAKEAAMSRSAFFDRFTRTVGMAPMAYLSAWRMALAQRMLTEEGLPIAAVAERVGYRSVSAFGVAFTRHAGESPGRYVRRHQAVGTEPANA